MSSMRNTGMVTDLTALNQYISGYGDNLWLTHNDKFVSDDLFVVAGPLTLKDLSKYTVGIQQNTHTVNVKCHSSRPIVDTESTDDLTIEPATKVYVTVAVYNRSNTPQTLPSGIIGDIHVSDNDTATKFQTAATDTAEQLAENVTAFLSSQAFFHQKASQTSSSPKSPRKFTKLRSYLTEDANTEMSMAFDLHSAHNSIISNILDDDRDISPLGEVKLDPFSDAYKDKVINELRLH